MENRLFPPDPVLLVDDEEYLLRSFDYVLQSHGITNVIRCADGREVTPLVTAQPMEVVVLDLLMPEMSGTDLLPALVRQAPDTPILVVTAINQVEIAVQCMRNGAFDYLLKPVDENRLLTSVRRAIEIRELRRENQRLKQFFLSDELTHPEAFSPLVTRDSKMKAIFRYVEAIAASEEPTLITGETGVGKELIARAIHAVSGRPSPFVAVNISGLDETAFSDSLFGHVRGAYTGATEARKGLIEQAAGGTLFLDEIADVPLPLQVKLLRFLQDREYSPLGTDALKKGDVRILVATNRNLRGLLASGKFREDLYYRLMVHHIHVPALRERPDDVPLLLDYFLADSAARLNKKKPAPPPELLTMLLAYHFPGNVRELKAMVHDAVSSHISGVLSLHVFRDRMGIKDAVKPGRMDGRHATGEGSIVFPTALPTLVEIRSLVIAEAMRRVQQNQTLAAHLLGISRQTLNRYLRGLEPDDTEPDA